MIGTGAGTMQDHTRGKGASFSAAECKLLNSALMLTADVLGYSASASKHGPLSGEEVELLIGLSAKCERGAGL